MLRSISERSIQPKPRPGDQVRELGGATTFTVKEVGMKYVVAVDSVGITTMVPIKDVVVIKRHEESFNEQ